MMLKIWMLWWVEGEKVADDLLRTGGGGGVGDVVRKFESAQF